MRIYHRDKNSSMCDEKYSNWWKFNTLIKIYGSDNIYHFDFMMHFFHFDQFKINDKLRPVVAENEAEFDKKGITKISLLAALSLSNILKLN